MPSIRFVSVGKARFLASLRNDLRVARNSLTIVCPWIDEYFADQVSGAASNDITVNVLLRPEKTVDGAMWPHMVMAVRRLQRHFALLKVRTLERLHAKVVVIDNRVAYVGSTNFYRFSLEQSWEIALRGPLAEMGDLGAEIKELFDKGKDISITTTDGKGLESSGGMAAEVKDPIVAEILRQNPKAWIIGERPGPAKRPK
jgi:hypothetical protein